MTEAVFFYIFGGLTVLMGFLMIVQTNAVASALCLIASFFSLAALYVLLSAPFVAVLQILIYAGAIMVLFVFVIMLLNLRKEDLKEAILNMRFLSYLVFGVLFASFIVVSVWKVPQLGLVELPEGFGSPHAVARLLFTDYLIPFELASILILVSVVGAVVLAKRA